MDRWMDGWLAGWMDGWTDRRLVDINHLISTRVNGTVLIYTSFRCGQKQIAN